MKLLAVFLAVAVVCCHLQLLVRCQEPGASSDVRLRAGATPCDGRVEIRDASTGEWQASCDHGWDYRDAGVVCNQVGCGMLHEVTQLGLYPPPTGVTPPLRSLYNCNGQEATLARCHQSPVVNASLCRRGNQAGVRCRMPCLSGDPYGLSYRGGVTREAYLRGLDLSRRQELTGPVVLGKRRRKRTPLHCPAYRCPYPGPIENGDILGAYYEFYGVGTILGVRCNRGYKRLGPSWIYCGHTGFWSDDHPLCLPEQRLGRTCRDPGRLANGNGEITSPMSSSAQPIPSGSYAPETEVKYSCRSGYFLIGYARAVCLHNGTWSRRLPFCANHEYNRYPPDLLTALLSATMRVVRGADWRYGNQDGGPGTVGTIVLIPTPGYVRVRWDSGRTFDYRMGASRAYDLYLFAGRVPSTTECSDPGIPQFGSRDNDGPFLVGQRVFVTCDPGYRLVSGRDSYIVCQPGLTWSDALPQCAPSVCQDPGTPSNSQRIPLTVPTGGFRIGSAVVYSCLSNFQLRGTAQLICLPNFQWSADPPACSNQCADPGMPVNGMRNGNSFAVGSVVSFVCQPTYRLVGSSQRRCGSDLQWTGSQPQCAALSRCADPGVPSQGSRTPSVASNTIFSPGDRVLYKCGAGYELLGAIMRVCQEDRSWSNEQPTCRRICCNDPGRPDNARRSGSQFCFNDVVEFSCLSPFQLVGAETITCQSDGSWSHALPLCVTSFSPYCARPCSPPQGSFTGDQFIVGARVQYSCNRGYSLDGARERRCQENLEWSRSCPQCKRTDCGDPGRPTNGIIEGSTFTFNSVVQFSCRSEYVLTGSAVRRCLENGSWSNQQPTCQERAQGECPQPVGFGVCAELCSVNSSLGCPLSQRCCSNGCGHSCQTPCPDNNCRTICPSGFELDARGCKMCICKLPVPCPDPGVVSFGSRQTNGFQISSTVVYECYAGYELQGSDTLTCQPDSTWDNPKPTCEPVQCPALSLPNGLLNPASPSNSFGTSIRFSCTDGYRLTDGDTVRTCRGNGQWSGRLPRCVLEECQAPPVLDNGSRLYQTTTVGSRVTWQCNPGYVLAGQPVSVCSIDRTWTPATPRCQVSNPCNSVQCQRFQECVEFEGRGVCRDTCSSGRCLMNETCSLLEVQCVTTPCFPVAQCSPMDPCLLPAEPGPCRATIPRYYYDDNRGECVPFTYGGCRGNANNFALEAQCRRQCVNAVCQSPQQRGSCGQQLPRYYFESRTQTCLSFTYSGCGGNFNIFASEEACYKRCKITCIDPGTPANGQRVVFPANSNFEPRTYITFSCSPGYRLVGIPIISCLENGSFSAPPPSCQQATCPDPGQVVNAVRSQSSSALTVSSTVTYTCSVGFDISGTTTRTCQPSRQWTGSPPVCIARRCPDPGTPTNGRRDGDNFAVEQTVLYVCDSGYRLVGADRPVCLPTGQWSEELPTCIELSCSNPGSVANGAVVASPVPRQFSVGTVLSIRCFTGFQVSGANNVTCLPTGRYSSNLPRCVLVTCRDPGMPTNGQRSGGDFGVGRIVQYRCDAGYNLEGPPVRVCQADGQWSGSLPTCSRPSCLPPSRIENGQRIVSPDNGLYSVGTTVTYSCVAGYSLLGTNVLRCLPNGQYSEPAPTCRVSSCSDPGTPANAIREGDEFIVSSVVRFTCRPGYTLRGTEFRVCQEDGSWTGTPPECTVSSCGNPGQPENGIRFGSTFTVGAAVLFTCNDGYRLVGDPRLTCQPNGQWNSARPVCTVNQCTDPGMVPQSTRTVSDRRFITGTVITYTCSSGYTLASGSLRLTCQSTGQYDNRPPVCDVLSCADPGQPDNGERYGDSFRVGATVAYGCNAGYNLVGGLTQQCQPDGQWSETRPTCQAVVITCGNPGLPDNAVRQGDSFTAGDVVSYTCRPGYTPVSGDLSRQCQSNGQWTGVLPTCQVSSTPPSGCSDPGTPRNGQRAVGAQFPNVGAIIRFRCLSGYRITGSIRRVCQANGQWSGTQPTCSTVQCAPVPPIAGALVTIVPDDGRYAAGTVVTVTCGEGFELIGESLLICDDSGRYSAALPQCQVATRPTTSAPVGITGNPVVTSSPSETPITPVWPDPAFTSAPTYVDLNLPASTQPSATYDVYILRPGEPTFSFLASYPVEPSISVQRVPIVPGDTYQFVIRARIGDLTSGNSAPITVPAEDTPATTPGPTDAVTTAAPDIPAPSWPAEAFTAAASYADLRFPGSLTPLLQYDVFIQRPGEPSFSFLATYEATNTISVQRVPLSPGQTYRFVFQARLGPTTSENSIPIIVVTGPGTDPVPDTSPTTSPGLAAPVWPEPSFSVASTYVDFNLPASNQP
eukprot:scpid3721/ scgid0121/ Sushi, von Willebrand factor type A, EGF and pentraxin domain-containing protein 1; CCP module-containing protein 22; Polydom; Selectin-like osteoblast-derived protein; Serologically defined breast cancer antigen NY-BR-38